VVADSGSDEVFGFASSCVEEAVVFDAIMGCGAVGVSTYFIHIAFSSFPTAFGRMQLLSPSLNLELRLVLRIFVLLAFFQCFEGD
jgi:hypothetical protein